MFATIGVGIGVAGIALAVIALSRREKIEGEKIRRYWYNGGTSLGTYSRYYHFAFSRKSFSYLNKATGTIIGTMHVF